jgi:alcohol dehydrogenase class IV
MPIICGGGSLEAFRKRFTETVTNDTLAVISRGAARRYGFSEFLVDKPWIWDIPSNPTTQSIARNLVKLTVPFSKIVAVGGGSTIDTAKAIIALNGLPDHRESIVKIIENKSYSINASRITNFIAVPTTAGTGSEVTRWATIWDTEQKNKLSIEADWLNPSEVWLVPELTVSLSPRQTLSTGLDALCQACEAFWAKKSDSLSKALAVQAATIIGEYLPYVLKNGLGTTEREEMLTGSLISGMAFSRTGTTACHSISYPLTALYGVEHGFAVALTLAQVAKRNAVTVDCGKLFEVIGAPKDLRNWLDSICADIQPLRLSAFGISDISPIVNKAFTAGRMDNNPVNFSEEDVEKILAEVF